MQKHQQLQRVLNDAVATNLTSLLRPISLELIIAALEKKGGYGIHYFHSKGCITLNDMLGEIKYEIDFTPLQPLPQESVEKLLEIFK